MKVRKTTLWQVLLVVFCLPCAAGSLADPPYVRYDKPLAVHELVQRRLQELLPADAIHYLKEHMACEHWFGEEAYDRERAKEIEAGIKRDCAARDTHRKKIHLRYKPGSAVRKRLDRIVGDTEQYRDDFAWDDPEMKSDALRVYYESTAQDLIRQAAALSADDCAADSGPEKRVPQLEVEIWRLLSKTKRLHPDTRRNIEPEYKRLQALCTGAALREDAKNGN